MNKEFNQIEIKVDEPTLNQPNDLKQAVGLFETISTVPTGKPTNLLNQIKFYSSGGTRRIYIYDAKNDTWRYATLT